MMGPKLAMDYYFLVVSYFRTAVVYNPLHYCIALRCVSLHCILSYCIVPNYMFVCPWISTVTEVVFSNVFSVAKQLYESACNPFVCGWRENFLKHFIFTWNVKSINHHCFLFSHPAECLILSFGRSVY